MTARRTRNARIAIGASLPLGALFLLGWMALSAGRVELTDIRIEVVPPRSSDPPGAARLDITAACVNRTLLWRPVPGERPIPGGPVEISNFSVDEIDGTERKPVTFGLIDPPPTYYNLRPLGTYALHLGDFGAKTLAGRGPLVVEIAGMESKPFVIDAALLTPANIEAAYRKTRAEILSALAPCGFRRDLLAFDGNELKLCSMLLCDPHAVAFGFAASDDPTTSPLPLVREGKGVSLHHSYFRTKNGNPDGSLDETLRVEPGAPGWRIARDGIATEPEPDSVASDNPEMVDLGLAIYARSQRDSPIAHLYLHYWMPGGDAAAMRSALEKRSAELMTRLQTALTE